MLIWLGWSAQRVYTELRAAEEQAVILKASLARGDIDGARHAAERLGAASESAAARTDGVAWQVFEAVPLLGDDAEGLAEVSAVLHDLSERGLPPLVESADDVGAGAFAPRDHAFPLRRIASVRPTIEDSAAAFAAGAERLDGIESDRFVSPLRRAVDGLRDEVGSGAAALEVMRRASTLMPKLLGEDGPRNYLLVFQNNAEARAGGGLPGTMSLIQAEDGRVDITRQEAAGPFGELDEPVLALTKAERSLYGDPLGTYFTDANFTPEFSRSAELWRARWRLETGTDIDGVFVIDPVAISYLLDAIGPIQIDGRTLRPGNLVYEVEHFTYLRFNQAAQDAFFNAVAKKAFDAFADGRGDSVAVLQGLLRSVVERRILMHSFVPQEQQLVADTRIAGHVSGGPAEPHVGVFLNSGSASKLSYFLNYQVDVTSAFCNADRQRLLGRLEITSDTPANVAQMPDTVLGFGLQPSERGKQLVVADLFAPEGGDISELRFDGEELKNPAIDSYLGRPVLSIALPLEPGQSRVVTWSMLTGPGQTGPTEVSVTPGSRPQNESSVAPTTC